MSELEPVKPVHRPKKVLVALPSGLLEQIDYVAGAEHRTRSDLIREALRRYLHVFSKTNPIRVVPTNLELIRRTLAAPPPVPLAPDNWVPELCAPIEPDEINGAEAV